MLRKGCTEISSFTVSPPSSAKQLINSRFCVNGQKEVIPFGQKSDTCKLLVSPSKPELSGCRQAPSAQQNSGEKHTPNFRHSHRDRQILSNSTKVSGPVAANTIPAIVHQIHKPSIFVYRLDVFKLFKGFKCGIQGTILALLKSAMTASSTSSCTPQGHHPRSGSVRA